VATRRIGDDDDYDDDADDCDDCDDDSDDTDLHCVSVVVKY